MFAILTRQNNLLEDKFLHNPALRDRTYTRYLTLPSINKKLDKIIFLYTMKLLLAELLSGLLSKETLSEKIEKDY
ncbi:MAG: hypothetical protein ABID79_00285 [Elusimicrobiota bacterium]